jgi:pimeloyl-ACP methyl ester carboxylesterase
MSDEARQVAALVATPPDVVVPVPGTDRVVAADLLGATGDPAVLLVHGTPDSRLARHPDPNATTSAGVRMVAVDRPGFGHSTFDPDATPDSFGHDLVALLDRLALADVAVVAWSAGALWALGLAAVAPTRVRSVTIIGGLAPFEAFDDPEVWAAAGEARRGMVETARDLGAAVAAEMIGPMLVPDPATPDAAVEHRIEHGSDDLAALAGADVQMAAATLDAVRLGTDGVVRDVTVQLGRSGLDLAAIDTPVHLVTGDRDTTCPPAFAHWFAAHLPAATVTIVPDAGHGLLLTHWCDLLVPPSIGDHP